MCDQPMQEAERGVRVGYLWRLFRALCSKAQNTTVMRTSPATVGVSAEEAASIC